MTFKLTDCYNTCPKSRLTYPKYVCIAQYMTASYDIKVQLRSHIHFAKKNILVQYTLHITQNRLTTTKLDTSYLD